MKIHPYYMTSAPWWMYGRHLGPIDHGYVLTRLGKALGMIK